ncbi:MAG: FliA/WhiG family RNA polymerase sigma factor [Limisphaerales bacterium]
MTNQTNAVMESPEIASAEPTGVSPQTLWNRYHQHASVLVEEELVIHYLPLVKTIVGRLAMHLPNHVRIEDLTSAGMIGLLQALRSYDPTSAASFETYARNRIRGAMLDELRRMDWVPRSVHDKARRMEKVMLELEHQLGRTPKEFEMAKALGISESDYQQWIIDVKPSSFLSLDTPAHPDDPDSGSLYEGVEDSTQEVPSDTAARAELVEIVRKRLLQLPDSQRRVLGMYYLEDMRLKEIAVVFGVTESRICQIHTQAILSLRTYLRKCDIGAECGGLIR